MTDILLCVLFLLTIAALADQPCKVAGCSGGFPPGHQHMGTSWWAIGKESYQATILNFAATLHVPDAPVDTGGVIVINPAMENTVSTIFAYLTCLMFGKVYLLTSSRRTSVIGLISCTWIRPFRASQQHSRRRGMGR